MTTNQPTILREHVITRGVIDVGDFGLVQNCELRDLKITVHPYGTLASTLLVRCDVFVHEGAAFSGNLLEGCTHQGDRGTLNLFEEDTAVSL